MINESSQRRGYRSSVSEDASMKIMRATTSAEQDVPIAIG